MRYTLATLALAALTSAMPQGVTSAISPSASAPAGCSSSYSGSFDISINNVTSGPTDSKVKRQTDTTLVMTLSDGILKDSKGRTGYIAANQQFQFDDPPQTGAIYTAGWSVCSNGSLTIGADSLFYKCLSGTFYNLYDEATAGQCSPIYIVASPVSGSSASATGSSAAAGTTSAASSGAASALSDGQVTASPVTSSSSSACVSQIGDGQLQATGCSTSTTVSAAVTQLSDGQPGVSSAVPATTAAPVSQISDGQVQATTAAPATTAVCEYKDGQPQAGCMSSMAGAVSQASDGQIVATQSTNGTYTTASATVAAYTGAAMPTAIRGELFGIAAAILGGVAML